MKRDMELIRQVLLQVERLPEETDLLESYSADEVKYHYALVIEAELAEGIIEYSPSDDMIPEIAAVNRLTWAGHDFVDAARADTVWNNVMSRVKQVMETVSFGVLTTMLKEAALEKVLPR